MLRLLSVLICSYDAAAARAPRKESSDGSPWGEVMNYVQCSLNCFKGRWAWETDRPFAEGSKSTVYNIQDDKGADHVLKVAKPGFELNIEYEITIMEVVQLSGLHGRGHIVEMVEAEPCLGGRLMRHAYAMPKQKPLAEWFYPGHGCSDVDACPAIEVTRKGGFRKEVIECKNQIRDLLGELLNSLRDESCNLVHRDLKLDNLYYDSGETCPARLMLGDLGESTCEGLTNSEKHPNSKYFGSFHLPGGIFQGRGPLLKSTQVDKDNSTQVDKDNHYRPSTDIDACSAASLFYAVYREDFRFGNSELVCGLMGQGRKDSIVVKVLEEVDKAKATAKSKSLTEPSAVAGGASANPMILTGISGSPDTGRFWLSSNH